MKENEVIQQKKYEKEQDDIKHIKEFIASCGALLFPQTRMPNLHPFRHQNSFRQRPSAANLGGFACMWRQVAVNKVWNIAPREGHRQYLQALERRELGLARARMCIAMLLISGVVLSIVSLCQEHVQRKTH